MNKKLSDNLIHFFHVVSNVRPIYWICLYVALMPLFAFFYWLLPAGEFRLPDDAAGNFGSWLYYSIVTITTLGFGDFTPAMPGAQTITAIEVVCGLAIFGFFLNAVGSMKSEIDVKSEIEKQKRLHIATEKEKIIKSTPALLHNLNTFLSYCYAVTTPISKRTTSDPVYNPDFTLNDMVDLYSPTGMSFDATTRPAVERLLLQGERTSLILDSFQNRIDLTPWSTLLEDCFSFVADVQMFASSDAFLSRLRNITDNNSANSEKETAAEISNMLSVADPDTTLANTDPDHQLNPVVELYNFVKKSAELARKIETQLTKIASSDTD